LTTSPVSFEPSLNVTSSRRVSVRTVLVSSYDHSVASHGSIVPSGVASRSVSNTAW
jgi:hypothetical protein